MAKPKAGKGPYVCVMIKSLKSQEDGESVRVTSWKPWVLDLKALDALSPPWLRKGKEASLSALFGVAEAFGEHCVALGKKAWPEARLQCKTDLSSEHQVGMLVFTLRLGAEATEEEQRAIHTSAISAIIGELRRLAGSSRRPATRLWSDAPEGAGDCWGFRLMGLAGDRERPWAPEFAAAMQSKELSDALPERPASQRARAL